MIKVDYDPVPGTTAGPVRVVIGPAYHRLTLSQAHELHEQLAGVLMQSDPPPDTLPAPPITPEPATTPGTPTARRRSSDRLQAIKPGGLAERVADELAKGKTLRVRP